MKKFALLILAALFIQNSADAGTIQNRDAAINISFIQNAKVATLIQTDAKKGIYTLTLTNIHPFVTYFSDRPNRIIGKLTNQEYIKEWQGKAHNNFGEDAPNAVLSGIFVKSALNHVRDQNIVMVLLSPHYDEAHATIRYTIRIINQDGKLSLPPSLKLYYSTLFIDSACLSCGH